jgi:gamma-glutamyltranspeptidase / glutathione hydrolase
MSPALPPGLICQKQPATGSRGMVVTNHPLASAAGAQMLLAGGNAIDAAIAALFALTVVEPMMVGILGGGLAHLRLAGGEHIILDGLSTAPAASTPQMYGNVEGNLPSERNVADRANVIGARAVAVPGALAAWCEALAQHGTMPLADVLQPAIQLASRGFAITAYLSDCIADCAVDLATDPGLAMLFLPGGAPLRPGEKLVQATYAHTLNLIAQDGPGALYNGPLGAALTAHVAAKGGIITKTDLANYRTIIRQPVTGTYRGYIILGPPPPASAGLHIVQMLNILESDDIGALGFGTPETIHLMAEALKIAFADRAVATADPDFIAVPVGAITSKAYAATRRAAIDPKIAQAWKAGINPPESANTTHVTVADHLGNVVASTQTINSLFGSCVQIPGTGMLANNYMHNFDPHPGRALSIAPGKRVFTSMSPMMATKDGNLRFALGLPGGLRIFPSAFQAILNLIDHRMPLQDAVEAPRIWTEGGALEIEPGISDRTISVLEASGHCISHTPRIAGGMNAIAFAEDGTMTGAACWRADGTPVGISGGPAKAGVRFTLA